MRYMYTVLNLDCWKCARSGFHCTNCVVALPNCAVAHLRGNTAHDITRHHHWRVSSWVMWLRMLRATTSLPKQPFAFFLFFLQCFSPEWPI